MDKKHTSQFEINDLIGECVNNAIARRNQVDLESSFSVLSEEEATTIAGGLRFAHAVSICDTQIKDNYKQPFLPVCAVGMIVTPDYKFPPKL
ncbi:hypothetical protein [Mastigocoleus sp. MO_188.B34]|uniref:hypothetical protein n=1 Tax=Mastigocoleus sp. MO_188.B34 TaxID=3036635 RepID=UPI0026033F44|nr:hypothetical protein [Mastigocoleus sp. MO_188.B34]MDJ0697503.1 hypothetical protein [Mastigocoleus sp. MO_188.B34]